MKNRIVVPVFVLLLTLSASVRAEEAVRDIGSRLELMADRHVIAAMTGTELRLHEPVPAEKVLAFDKEWEGRYCGYVTVIQDGELFRMYYRGLPVAGADGSSNESTCYAESKDGVNWTRPDLNDKHTNVILTTPPYCHNFAPFLDTRPGVPPAERFKALAGTDKTGLHGMISADGVKWSVLQDEPLITKGLFDSQNIAFWSESEQQYLCYFRSWKDGYRWIARTTSPDFRTWSEPIDMDYGDTQPEHLYTNQTVPYFRAPHLYVAIAARFMPERKVVTPAQSAAIGIEERYDGDCSDAVFMTTRGGTHYDRTFMEAFVRPGIGPSNWTSRTNYPARGIVPVDANRMAFYVQRHYGQPTHHLQRMILRTDGFASVHAGYAGGEMATLPLLFKGKELTLNYSTSAPGSVRVELQDAKGTPLPGHGLADCDEIIGDEIERVVTWKGSPDLGATGEQAVRIRFALKDADLYSLRFR